MCNKANSWNKTNLLTNYRFFINRQFVFRVTELASSGGSRTLGLRVPSTHLQGREKNRAEKQRTEPLRGCVLLASFGSAALTCFHTEVPPLDVRLETRPPLHPNPLAKALTERNRQGPSLERRGPLTNTPPSATRCCFWNSSCVARPRVRPAEREQGGWPTWATESVLQCRSEQENIELEEKLNKYSECKVFVNFHTTF